MNPKEEIFERQIKLCRTVQSVKLTGEKTFKCKFLLMYIVRILVVRLKFTFYSLLMMTNNVLGGGRRDDF